MDHVVTRVEKPWGYELHWARTERYVGKILHINAGHALSLQYHNRKDETVYLYTGKLLYEIEIDGKTQLGLTKQIQIDPITRFLEHVDFVAVKKGEKVTVNVPIHVIGEAAAETLVVTENSVVSVEAEATHIPEYIEVDIEGAEVGTQILASQLTLPSGSTLLTDDETLIVNVTQQMSEEELEAELEEAEAEAGIEREEAEGEAEEAVEGAEGEAAEGAEGAEAAAEGSDEE